MKKLGPFELNTCVCGDSTELLKEIPDESLRLIAFSPPYNLGMQNASKSSKENMEVVVEYDDYDDNMEYQEYIGWQHEILHECWRALRDDGAIYYNHRPRTVGGTWDSRMQLIPDGVNIRQTIVWARPKGHNWNGTFYVPDFEWIFLLAKPKFRLTRSAVAYGTVWYIKPKRSKHPAPWPMEIPSRAIESVPNVDLVLDPFAGEGTTMEAAAQEGIDWLGFEISPKWAKISEENARNTKPLITTIRKVDQLSLL